MKDQELILKYIKEEATPLERETLENWLLESDANKLVFTELKKTWDTAGKLDQRLAIDKPKAWQSIQQKIVQEQSNTVSGTKKSFNTTWLLRIAATLIVSLFAAWFFLTKNEKENLVTLKTEATKKMIVLADCTRVFLNTNSSLVYPEDFTSDERKVILTGEAFFEVKRNEKSLAD